MNNQFDRLIARGVFLVLIVIGFAVLLTKGCATVRADTFHVKQAFGTGKMSAKLTPGVYAQSFGKIWDFPKSETYRFTYVAPVPPETEETRPRENGEDDAIHVRFNDGSSSDVLGTVRVNLNVSEQQAIEMVTKHRFTSWEDLQSALILPIVRRTLTIAGTTMNATESYQSRRDEFINMVSDQLENGYYQTRVETIRTIDPLTGEEVDAKVSVVVRDASGEPRRVELVVDPLVWANTPEAERRNLKPTIPLWKSMGIDFSYYDQKNIQYADNVTKQINTQQESRMAVETAKAKALQAEQDALTAEANGRAEAAKAKWEQEVIKSKNVVIAEEKRDVAELELEASEFKKQAAINEGEGEGARRRAIMSADGGLDKKLEAWTKAQEYWAEAYKVRQVPAFFMGGGGANSYDDSGFNTFMNMMSLNTAKSLGLDLTMPKGAEISDKAKQVNVGTTGPNN